ncbi:hypothetical protein [Mycobacterium montefiorense]|uniref:Uncharacterized protein n=1 Tax=Mycobacterium montefiorense TaxID=154654 RepID=A0AA37USI5_9MYCO|nr:hypothetical protein [Mycobacterium montefiorense]GBG38412.1 hypothetical protein MmonteBS_27840 [Mycobacterium montefiorense]GKU34241.1 hypothetical protein NJB14191_15870 [Mycobacterium montefiorense]GKU38860.1 hypothetical protein NJB14192_08560 [Mycobacterium montefiorense]GKU48104.1 hypothetical protein NJB14194_47200 [Mycobacterium montefiorense]GKU57423.1 hypothetical protein NJB14197_32830 [Mycobacterium montefiorense]
MDFAGLPEEPDPRPVLPHHSSGGRDRRGRTPHVAAVRPVPGHVHQAGALSAHRPAAAADRVAYAADTADQRQADYFLRLLNQNRRLIDQRIDGYHKAIAVAEARDDAESASVFRRTARIEEQERKALDRLIENLQRRFVVQPTAQDPPLPRGSRLVVR